MPSERHLVLTPADFAAGYTVREPYDDGVTLVRRDYVKLWELPDGRIVVRDPKLKPVRNEVEYDSRPTT